MTASFQSSVWPEDPVPAYASGCDRCELARQRKRIVWGEGTAGAPILAFLDNPGAREDPQGNPFVCGTRDTLQRAVHEAGLLPRDLYVTYALRCRPIRAYDKPAARSACRAHWLGQLAEWTPELAVCLGSTAAGVWFGDPEAEAKTLRGAWHEVHGIRTLVTYHPLAVRRRPNLWKIFLQDWKMVADFYHSSRSRLNLHE